MFINAVPDIIKSEVELPCEYDPNKEEYYEYCERLHHHDNTKKSWKYCKNQSKSIEVIYNDDDQKILAKVHFRTDPLVSRN